MLKRYLLAPGPTPVPPEVLLAMARPMIHHRAPEFDKLFAEVREDLKWLFQTRNDVLILAASGTGGMTEGATGTPCWSAKLRAEILSPISAIEAANGVILFAWSTAFLR